MANYFGRKLQDLAKERNSRLILALDLIGSEGLLTSRKLVKDLREHLVGVKFGYPTILSNQAQKVSEFIAEFSDEVCFIADAKIADVSHVNALIGEILYSNGFDAVIAHGFMGYEGGLDGLSRVAHLKDKGLIVLLSMSNKGAMTMMDNLVDGILGEALKADPSGFVAPATRPEVIKKIRAEIPPIMKIFSPGVGAQGAPPGSALSSGADYEIVGRAIYESADPASSAKSIVRLQREAILK